jgi:hypothetical protein
MSIKIIHFDSTNSCNLFDNSSIFQFFWANTEMRSYFVKYLRQNILLISQCERFYEANSGKGGKSTTKEKPDKSTIRIRTHFSELGRCALIRFRLYQENLPVVLRKDRCRSWAWLVSRRRLESWKSVDILRGFRVWSWWVVSMQTKTSWKCSRGNWLCHTKQRTHQELERRLSYCDNELVDIEPWTKTVREILAFMLFLRSLSSSELET